MTADMPLGLARRGFVLAMAAAVSGCGFRPVYAVRGGASSPARRQLGLIDVALLPDRPGQLLRQALQQRLSNPGEVLAKRYELSIAYGISSDSIGVQQDSTITRIRQTGTANWSLKMLDPASTLVTNGTARTLDGLNVIDQQYFEADLAGEAAQRRIADAIADQITLQLASYFARHEATG